MKLIYSQIHLEFQDTSSIIPALQMENKTQEVKNERYIKDDVFQPPHFIEEERFVQRGRIL